MSLEINKNLNIVKQGIFDAIELFKIQYAKNKNIIIDKNNTIYVNNIEQILTRDESKNKYYLFGFNFVLDNINNLRANICINPILYLLSLQILFSKINNLKELNRFTKQFEECNNYIKNYYKMSSLSKAKVSLDDIELRFNNLLTTDFIKKVCEYAFEPCFIQIQESKQNNIYYSDLYELRATYVCGRKIIDEETDVFLWWNGSITEERLVKFLEFIGNRKVVLICFHLKSELLQFIKNNFINITVYIIPENRGDDICKITKCEIYDGFSRLEDYKTGKLKKLIFSEGILKLKNILLDEKDIHLDPKKREHQERYYMLLGKTLKIECTEDIMENVRAIVSLIKSISLEGVFYDIPTTLKLLTFCTKNNALKKFLNALLREYLLLNEINILDTEMFISQQNLKKTIDVKTGNFVENKSFTAISLYLNTFGLLESNIEVMKKVY